MIRTTTLAPKVFLLVFMLIGCVPIPIPYPSKPVSNIDSQSLNFPSINREEIDLLAEQDADRKKIINILGRPIQYRTDNMSYNVCYRKGGLGVLLVVPMVPYGGGINVAGGDITCYELMLVFDEENNLKQIVDKQEALEFDEYMEDLNLKKLGLLGDPIAQSLWLESKSYLLQRLDENPTEVDAKELMQLYWRMHLTDIQEALRWLCRAVDHGSNEASYQLGVSYRYGIDGLPVDRARAYLWYSLAAQGGYNRAKIQRQELISEMSVDQLESGKGLLDSWQPSQCEREVIKNGTVNIQ